MKSFTDKEILEIIRDGNDNDALSYLYRKVFPKIKQYIKSNSGNDDEAWDIFQDAMVAFYNYVKKGKFNEKYEIEAFLYSVSRNLWINYVKKQNRNIKLSEEYGNISVDESVTHEIISSEKEKTISEMLSKLGDRCRELLTYFFYHKMNMQQIAEKMGFANENAVKTKKYKCKERLIELVRNNPSLKRLLKD